MSIADHWKSKLTRASVKDPARWAEEYRFMGDKKWSFRRHPWLLGMHQAVEEECVGQKGAQLGFSEAVMNIALANMDIHKRHVLYLLPNARPDASDFTARAFNPAIETSPHIKTMFAGGTDNVHHKVSAAGANLYIRGSNVASALKSIPVNLLIQDEFDEMDQDNVPLAEERLSGQTQRQNWKISTPTAPNAGINSQFLVSSQDHFVFPCPRCSRMTTLKFPDCLVIVGEDPNSERVMESHLVCKECKGVLHHHEKPDFLGRGDWVSTYTGRMIRGFHVNQLYSTALPAWKLAKAYLLSLKDVDQEREFFNSKMGQPHIVASAQLSEEMLERAVKTYAMAESCRKGSLVTMGVDVGKKLHTVIMQWDTTKANPVDITAGSRAKLLWAGECDDFAALSQRMGDYHVNSCVVDIQPETRLATEFANAWYGRVLLCRYNSHAAARTLVVPKEELVVTANRTAWLDAALGRFRNGTIMLPRDLPKDYLAQIQSPVRTPMKDNHGNLVYRYIERDNIPDHYAHAATYAEIALAVAVTGNEHKSI